MRNLLIVLLSVITINATAQSWSNIEKLKTAFETASTIKDFKDLIDGDIASSICSLLGGGPVCELLSVKPLNGHEKQELTDAKSKYDLEQFLIKKGIDPDEFYKKLLQQKNSETIQSRLNFLKRKIH